MSTQPDADTQDDLEYDYPTKPAISTEVLHPVDEDVARVAVTAADGRKWHLDVTRRGEYSVVASWNPDGELADIEVPTEVEAEVRGLA
jgi:hypothetical protein